MKFWTITILIIIGYTIVPKKLFGDNVKLQIPKRAEVTMNMDDFQKAKKLCKKGDAWKCYKVGFCYEKGKNVKQNYLKALIFYDKSCENNIAEGCHALGEMYLDGKGVKQNFSKALTFFGKTCNIVPKTEIVYGGCYVVGEIYKGAFYTLKSLEAYKQAIKFYQKACDGNFTDGCKKLKEMEN